jgi:hypothetical protein
MCGSWIRGIEIHQAISRSGRMVRLCEHCHTSATGTCGLCSSREICQIINAGRFCPHAEYTIMIGGKRNGSTGSARPAPYSGV